MTELARCSKCQAYVFRAPDDVLGGTLAVDVVPVDRQAYITALVAGTATYDAVERPGRPTRLRLRGLRSPAPTFDAGGAQNGTQRVLVEHGCAGATYPPVVKPVDEGKVPRPATPGKPSGGNHPGTAHVAGQRPLSVAGRANHHPSDTNSGTRIHTVAPQTASEALGGPGVIDAPPGAPGASRGGGKGQVFRGGSDGTAAPSKSTISAPVRCNTCDRLIDQTKPFAGIQHGRWVWAVHWECP